MFQPLAGTNSSEIKAQNISAILLAPLHHSGISRVQLAQSTGVSTATITNLVNELMVMGLVAEEGTVKVDVPQVGRPQKALRLIPQARYAIGVHIDIDQVRVMLANLQAQAVRTYTLQHDIGQPWERLLDELIEVIQHLIQDASIDPDDIAGVGVASPGLVDLHSGTTVIASSLNWRDVPICEYLSERLELPVVVENNVRAMALGEALFGDAQDVHALAFAYARIGVGAGLVVGGQLYRGATAGAGEIGHTTIVLDDGITCHCGNTGCLETLVSEPAIIKQAQRIAGEEPEGLLAKALQNSAAPTLQQVFNVARAGDRSTQTMLADCACYMGVALANLINIFNPELIILGGLFYRGEDLLLPAIEDSVRQRAFANLGQQVQIRTTEFGDDVGMVGAVALALDTFFYRPQNRLGKTPAADGPSLGINAR